MPKITIDYTTPPDKTYLPSFIQFLDEQSKNDLGAGYLSSGSYGNVGSDFEWQLTQNVLYKGQEAGSYLCYFIGKEDEDGYPTLKKLEEGGFGTVYKLTQIVSVSAIHFKQGDQQFALKVQSHCKCTTLHAKASCELQHNPLIQSQLEYDNIKQVPHLNAQLFYHRKEVSRSYIIMQQLLRKDLHTIIHEEMPQFSLSDRMRLSTNFMAAVSTQITPFVTHSDLKMENVMVTDNLECNLCDYANATQNADPVPVCSSLQTMAPELFKAYYESKPYIPNEKIDVWAAGIILLEIWGGDVREPTIEQYEDHGKFLQITLQDYVAFSAYFSNIAGGHKPNAALQKEISTLLANMLKFNPEERFTFKQAVTELQRIHTRFVTYGELMAKEPSLSVSTSPKNQVPNATEAPLLVLSAQLGIQKPLSVTTKPSARKDPLLTKLLKSTAKLKFFDEDLTSQVTNAEEVESLRPLSRVHMLAPLPLVTLETRTPPASQKFEGRPVPFRYQLFNSDSLAAVTLQEQQSSSEAATL